ncbi:hypothetical protein A3860_08790 [Niastella vici]|uniref:Uncharacterized protein n=1 Tax=Niastella vici TaxID=1703345 RepID=A0A1V9FHG4_9BACT|nr:hypothetical protein [Niastella vici]OQP57717.1 hypothetical protein A3860_08790 [Niastella vici]
MEPRFQKLSAAQLRTIIIHEMRKFAMALEFGATISDLQEIREQIRLLADALAEKEKDEDSREAIVENLPQSIANISLYS